MPVSHRGLTLVELVVGIVVLSIALVTIGTLIAPQARRSVEPILQVRATELAQSLLMEIQAKRFDETTDDTASQVTDATRCNDDLNGDGDFNEEDEAPCTAAGALGPEAGETRATFDDVDDFNGLQETGAIENSLGNALQVNGQNLYAGFTVRVSVVYDGNYDGQADNNHLAKLITVAVTTSSGDDLVFSSYRSNF